MARQVLDKTVSARHQYERLGEIIFKSV